MAKGYEYDVFVSYNRGYPVENWVRNHFIRKLEGSLDVNGLINPRIFIDKEIKTGTDWEHEIKHALKTSRCLVSVLSPRYFYSKWCLTEYYTMLKREQLLSLRTEKNRQGLIFPVIYSDCDDLPREFKRIQYLDMHELNCPEEVFERDIRYIRFDDEMKKLSKELIPMIKSAPKWKPDWPVVHKNAKPIINVPFPRI